MFYVYEWYIKSTNEVIYVGKGFRNRYRVKKHNKFFNEMIKRYDCDSRIVKEFESEQDAFEYEFVRIRELKSINQCVCNIHEGGYGGSTEWWTDDVRKKYSEKNVMKSQNQRQRMSDNNPMKNKDVSSRVAKKKSRAVIIDGIEYESVKNAALQLGVCKDTIQSWCIRGCDFDGKHICSYKDGQIRHYKKRAGQSATEPNEIR